MSSLTLAELAPLLASVQLLICLAATAVVCLLNQFAPKRYFIRWVFIIMIIGSGWSAIALFNYNPEFAANMVAGETLFLLSVLLMLVWVMWFHIYHLPRTQTGGVDCPHMEL